MVSHVNYDTHMNCAMEYRQLGICFLGLCEVGNFGLSFVLVLLLPAIVNSYVRRTYMYFLIKYSIPVISVVYTTSDTLMALQG